MKQAKKAYFVNSEADELYELSSRERRKLEKLYPKWLEMDCEKNYQELNEVYDFFKKHGKLLANPLFNNIFVGLTV